MRHFRYRELCELERSAEELGAAHVRFEHDPARVSELVARKVPCGKFTLGNSLAIHPMEGCDGTLDGRPDQLTWRRYERFARGGAKLIWFEATAVREDGRANARQLWIHRANVSDFARLLEALRLRHRQEFGDDAGLLAPMQLTHSGRFSVPRPVVACRHPLIDQKTNIPPDYPLLPDGELERLEDDYVEAARLAWAAGFEAIDIKATHGYLASELLSAKTRPGRYGGRLENRLRFLANIMGKIRAALGSGLLLCMRLGCYDGVPFSGRGAPLPYPAPYPGGFGVDSADPLREDLGEVIEAIRRFRDSGIELLNVSMGCPYYNPHVGRPFEKPDEGNYEQPEHPLLGVDRHFRVAARLQRAFPDLPLVGAGYSWLQHYSINAGARNIADGNIRLFGLGRGALAYPDFARDALEKGALDPARVCKTLTFCTFLMRQKNHPLGQFPTGCPPFDREVYAPILRQARAAKKVST